MKKLLFLFIYIIFSLFTVHYSLASNVPVETVFSDISKDYKYYDELQTLYDMWMMYPDKNGEFSPKKLLNRDEFIGIALESSCKKCIKPNTALEYLQKYVDNPFFDVPNNNKYFYCISESKDSNFVQGYDVWEVCDDQTTKIWEVPFCVNNKITLEEAISIILRMSWILTASEAENIRQMIREWAEFPDLSLDVKPKNSDGSVYSFYPDFKEALQYSVLEYDKNWNQKVLKLLEKNWDYIRPDKFVTKEEFLLIAYVALKANSCIEKKEDTIALSIKAYDENCSETKNNCTFSGFNNSNNTYDFWFNSYWICEKWVNNTNWYIWRFYNEDTWQQILRYWKYIDNFTFLWNGRWVIFFSILDECWNVWQVEFSLFVAPKDENDDNNNWDSNEYNSDSWNDSKLSCYVDMVWDIFWDWPFEANFKGSVSWGKWPYTYYWDFGNWETDSSYNNNSYNYTYSYEWVYKVSLDVEDSNWLRCISPANLNLNIEQSINCSNDTDRDWVYDCDDTMPLIPWDPWNDWAPIYEEKCNNDKDCDNWFICSDWWYCSLDNNYLNLSACLSEQNSSSFIIANSINNTCSDKPNFLDFIAKLRKCDIVFPAITSPDETIIYSKWNFFQIK